MSNLKRYACQIGKVLVGLPIIVAVILFVGCIGYLLNMSETAMAFAWLLSGLVVCWFAFNIGDELFKKYNICQRFR